MALAHVDMMSTTRIIRMAGLLALAALALLTTAACGAPALDVRAELVVEQVSRRRSYPYCIA